MFKNFNLDIKSTLFQLAALVLGLILILSSVDNGVVKDSINALMSLNIPTEAKPFTIGSGVVLLFYTIIK